MDLWVSVEPLTETKIAELSWWVHLHYQLVTGRGEHRGLIYSDLFQFQHHNPHFFFPSSKIFAIFWPQASAVHMQRAGCCKNLHPCYIMGDCLLQHTSYRSKTNLLPKEHLLRYKSLTWSVLNRSCAKWCSCPLGDANSWGWGEPCCISSRQTKAHLCSCKGCNLFQSSVEQQGDLGCVAATWFVLGKIHTSFTGSYIVSRTIASALCAHRDARSFIALTKFS